MPNSNDFLPVITTEGLVTGKAGDFSRLAIAVGTPQDTAERTGFYRDAEHLYVIVDGVLAALFKNDESLIAKKIVVNNGVATHTVTGLGTINRDVSLPDKSGTVAFLDDIVLAQSPGTTPGSIVYWNGSAWVENTNVLISGTNLVIANDLETNGIDFQPIVSNPGGASTLWYNSAEGKLFLGAAELNTGGLGAWLGNDDQIAFGVAGNLNGDNTLRRVALADGSSVTQSKTHATNTNYSSVSTKDSEVLFVQSANTDVVNNTFVVKTDFVNTTISFNSVNVASVTEGVLRVWDRLRIDQAASDPAAPVNGDIWAKADGLHTQVSGVSTKIITDTDLDELAYEADVPSDSLPYVRKNKAWNQLEQYYFHRQLFEVGTDYTSGVTTFLTLNSEPESSEATLVSFDGLLQDIDTFSVNTNIITFTAPLTASKVEVIWIAGASPAVKDHNDLLNIQGGNSTERYHLTLAEYTALMALITQPMGIDSLTGGSVNEIGSTVNSVNLAWTYNNSDASPNTSQSFNNGIGSLSLAARAYVYNTPIVSNTTFTLTAVDSQRGSASASTTVSFTSRRFWGVTTSAGQLIEAQIEAGSSELSANRNKSIVFDCTGGRRIFFAYPVSYGLATVRDVNNFIFQDWLGGVTTPYTVSITNSFGYTQDYYVYHSNNIYNSATVTFVWS